MLTRLGPYRILTLIGEGAMGSVYQAERVDGQFDQRVAIRVLRAGLKHPYIAQLINGGSVEGLSYIVIELIDGTPIDAHCKGLHLNLRDRLQLFILVCKSVQHAHASFIVHRDLKPANILVTSDGIPKLPDVGIARHLESEQTIMAPMTPRYASPEQLNGEPITVASGLYSLGIILCDLLEQFQISTDLKSVLALALREEPGLRYGPVAQFAEDIQRNPVALALGFVLSFAVMVGAYSTWNKGRLAQQRFDAAHNLILSVLNEVDAEAATVAGATAVRKLMVEKSLTYLNRLASDSALRTQLTQELARAHHQVGDIRGHLRTQNLGLFEDSRKSHLKGIAMEESLLRQDVANPKLRSQIA